MNNLLLASVPKKIIRPKFAPGDQVHYRHRGRTLSGVIDLIVNLGDIEDIHAQGYRYYVKIGEQMWSVAEPDLSLDKSKLRTPDSRGTK